MEEWNEKSDKASFVDFPDKIKKKIVSSVPFNCLVFVCLSMVFFVILTITKSHFDGHRDEILFDLFRLHASPSTYGHTHTSHTATKSMRTITRDDVHVEYVDMFLFHFLFTFFFAPKKKILKLLRTSRHSTLARLSSYLSDGNNNNFPSASKRATQALSGVCVCSMNEANARAHTLMQPHIHMVFFSGEPKRHWLCRANTEQIQRASLTRGRCRRRQYYPCRDMYFVCATHEHCGSGKKDQRMKSIIIFHHTFFVRTFACGVACVWIDLFDRFCAMPIVVVTLLLFLSFLYITILST